MWLAPAVVPAQGRTPIAHSLELAVLQLPAVTTIEGVRHLVYELHITNLRSIDVVLTRLEVLDADRSVVLGAFQDAALQAALGRPGFAKSPADPRQLAAGMRAVFYAWMPLGDAAAPLALSHRVEGELIRPTGRERSVTQGGRTGVRRDQVLVLGPPLQGGRWVAVYGPSIDRGHRRFVYTTDGRSRIPARFAVDWMKLGDDNAFVPADRTKVASWYGYGANVLAVADATVADARDDIPEDAPITDTPAPVALENASGNYVALDLGGGRFAFYEHLKPGSIKVKAGKRVRRGDVIAQLGNTGSSSSGPHLHFHVSDSNALLGAEGMPFVFDRFEVLGGFQFPDPDAVASSAIVPLAKGLDPRRRRELPAPNAIVRF